MLVPLTRKKFEDLMPLIATGPQYRYYWGNPTDVLRRALISAAGASIVGLIWIATDHHFESYLLVAGLVFMMYWFWAPVYWASRRNWPCRKYRYAGFWQGEVLDLYVTEELVGQTETTNRYGELVIVEDRERRLNLEVGDETGFTARHQVPLKRIHQAIRVGDRAEMVLMSNRPDLSRITQISDLYLPDCDLWVSDYPYLRRDTFKQVRQYLEASEVAEQYGYGDRPYAYPSADGDRYSLRQGDRAYGREDAGYAYDEYRDRYRDRYRDGYDDYGDDYPDDYPEDYTDADLEPPAREDWRDRPPLQLPSRPKRD
jgi:hypothetical protein